MNCSAGIAYSNSWTNQTGSLGSASSPLNFFTASSAGLYRLNIGASVSGNPGTGVNITPYANTNGTLTGGYLNQNATASTTIAFLVSTAYLKVGDTFGIFADASSLGAGNYDLFITIEQLQ